MAQKPTILILTSKTGGGHVSLAEALRERLEHDYCIEILDPQLPFIHAHYRFVSRHASWLWLSEFKLLNSRRPALFAHRIYARAVASELERSLDRLRPGLVLTTYPFLTDEVTSVLRKRSTLIPFAVFFSDPDCLHATWLTERNAAATFAPTRETYHQALATGIPRARLCLSGWPVREQFYSAEHGDRGATLTHVGLSPNRFTVFLQGGGEGAARLASTVDRILSAHHKIQIILAVGTNHRLLRRFEHAPNVYAFPFKHHIAPLMWAADVVMGKAGPNSLFEAVTLEKPFVATSYIPGQEKPNLAFIQRHGLGWVALSPQSQHTVLRMLAMTPAALRSMIASVREYREWNIAAGEGIQSRVATLLPPGQAGSKANGVGS